MNNEKEAVWSVTSLPECWEYGDPSQASEGSPASAAVVGLVVVEVESTSESWAPRSCSPGSGAPSRGVQDEKARAEKEEAVDGIGPWNKIRLVSTLRNRVIPGYLF